MYTIENLFHFLHQLSAVVWLGGTDLYGRAVIAPAATVALLTGLVLVAQMDLALSDLWVAWGLVGLLLSLGLGATLIRATNAELRRLAADPGLDTPRWPAMQRRVATVYGSNLLLLLSVLWAMVFKPTLCPSRDRRSAAARRSPSLPATPRASCCWLGCCSANATWNKVRRPGRRTP